MKEQDVKGKFEQLLAKKADGFQLKPNEAVWQRVQAQVNHERRRKIALWWISVSMVTLLAASGGTWMLMHHTTNNTSTTNQVVLNNPALTDVQQNTSSKTETLSEVNSTLDVKNSSASTPIVSSSHHHKQQNNSVVTNSNSNSSSTINSNSTVVNSNHQQYEFAANDNQTANQDQQNSVVNSDNQPTDKPKGGNEVVPIQHHTNFFHRFSLSAELSPLVTFRSLHSNGFNDSLVKLRNHNDQVFMGMAYTGKLRYDFSKTMTASIGIGYAKTGEGISVKKNYTGYYDSTQVGNPFVATDSVMEYGTDLIAVNRYNYLEIPVEVEWTIHAYKNNFFTLNCGASYEMLKKVETPFYTMNSNPTFPLMSTTANDAGTLRSGNVKVLIGLNYRNEISNHFIFTGGVQWNTMLLNMFPKEYPLSERPYWGGLKAGLIYHF